MLRRHSASSLAQRSPLHPYGGSGPHFYHKVFKAYMRVWRYQQENRASSDRKSGQLYIFQPVFEDAARSCKPPEPYKGKGGIMYIDQVIKKKEGKRSK